jgi:serine/threonine-protein kinase
MGVVYRALDPALERQVAIKVMLPEVAGDPDQKQRFEREARAVARLSHLAVVTVFDLGYHTDGSFYIVMELLRGRDLLARVRAGPPLSLEEKLSIVTQVLDGLGHAHKAGIVHRDVKPANVFITDEGSARIMDSGSRSSTGGYEPGRARDRKSMSPEQVCGERVDGRTICSASARCSASSPAVVPSTQRPRWRRSTGSPTGRPPSRCRPSRNTEPSAGPAAALASAVEERYATAAEFAAALRACGGGDTSDAMAAAPGRARATPDAARQAPSDSAPGAVPTTEKTAPRPADPSGLFRLLREIYVGGKSGHLHLASSDGRKNLRIRHGQIATAPAETSGISSSATTSSAKQT